MPKRKYIASKKLCDHSVKNFKPDHISFDDTLKVKMEPSEKLANNHDDVSDEVESLENDISNLESDNNFSIIKNKINLLGTLESNQGSNILNIILTKLNLIDEKINEIKLDISLLKQKILDRDHFDHINPTPDSFEFDKCQTIIELINLAKNLHTKDFYSEMITTCSKLGGNDEYDCTYKILKFLTRKDVLGCMNKTGTFNKTKFPVIIIQLIYESILTNFDCSYSDIEKYVGRVLHNCIPNAKKSLLR